MLSVKQIDGRHRVVNEMGVIALRLRDGKPCDGGGHCDEEKAKRQCQHMNDGFERRKKLQEKL